MMKILHTADWHLGQQFYEYDRTAEHQAFLNWLKNTLVQHHIDVVLISGDVFDSANPSAVSVRMFYDFLQKAVSQNPELHIIVTAGNHDAAQRLEAPLPLLSGSNIHIIGYVEKQADGAIDYQKLIIQISKQQTQICCLAIPYIRLGDGPHGMDYESGVAHIYEKAYEFAKENSNSSTAIIAMGHMHVSNAEITDMDAAERKVIGGMDGISSKIFHPDLAYVALGHIHKAQRIGGKENIRYSGSPIPMSFSEKNYKHQVVVFEINETAQLQNLETLTIPVSVPLLSIPDKPQNFQSVLNSILELEDFVEDGEKSKPYLEVKVQLDAPEPGLRHKIEKALEGKNVNLARISVSQKVSSNTEIQVDPESLKKVQPIDILKDVYQAKYDAVLPNELEKMFDKVLDEITHKANEA